MVVVDHSSGRLVWAKAGHDRATLRAFFDQVGVERCARIRLVSCDAAEWIAEEARANCPGVIVCIDPFHVAQWQAAPSTRSAAAPGTRRGARG